MEPERAVSNGECASSRHPHQYRAIRQRTSAFTSGSPGARTPNLRITSRSPAPQRRCSYSCILRHTPPCSAMRRPRSGSFPGHFAPFAVWPGRVSSAGIRILGLDPNLTSRSVSAAPTVTMTPHEADSGEQHCFTHQAQGTRQRRSRNAGAQCRRSRQGTVLIAARHGCLDSCGHR